jgi:hypothetical protein
MDDQARFVDLPNEDLISVSNQGGGEDGEARTVVKILRGAERRVGLVLELAGAHEDRTALERAILIDLLQTFGTFAAEHLLAPFRPDDAQHRGRLLAALHSYGLPAREKLAPKQPHIVVSLFDQQEGLGAGSLDIVSGDMIVLDGWGGKNAGPVTTRDWEVGSYPATTLLAAVVAFLIFWGQRREWIKRYQHGELDEM